jgi:hypothetical protein
MITYTLRILFWKLLLWKILFLPFLGLSNKIMYSILIWQQSFPSNTFQIIINLSLYHGTLYSVANDTIIKQL